MQDSVTYDVITNGEIISGFESTDVQQAFAKLFNTDLEKAAAFLGNQRTLKKAVSLETARNYVARIEGIGLAATLIENRPVSEPVTLTLEPTEEELRSAKSFEPAKEADTLICPKCQKEQPKSDQCIECGVFIHKILNNPNAQVNMASAVSHSENASGHAEKVTPATDTDPTDIAKSEHSATEDEAVAKTSAETDKPDSLKPLALLAAAVTAIIGAILWKFIALTFDYELGIVAWLIGGAVGFVAALAGSRGQLSGICCGVFAFCAIIGGKYMVTESIQSEWISAFSDESGEYNSELRLIHQGELLVAEAFQDEVRDEASLREFLVEYDYSEATSVADLSEDDVVYFKEHIKPRLERIAATNPDFGTWLSFGLKEEIENVSTFDLMQENLGLLDIIFLLLGVGTAFRLGSGNSS